MKPPSWKTCDENELWRYVAWHLEGEGISCVLVGGAVVSIYSKGSYRSGDLNQALLVCKTQADKITMAELAAWCEGEGSSQAFQELQRNLKISHDLHLP